MYSPYSGTGMSTLGPMEVQVEVAGGCFLYLSKCDFFARNLFFMSAMKVTFTGKMYNVMQSYKIHVLRNISIEIFYQIHFS